MFMLPFFRREQLPVLQPNLIFDIGVHDGSDSDFYLAKGFSVVGVEANPQLVAGLHCRYAGEIEAKRYFLCDKALSDRSGQQLPFYVNGRSEWSSLYPSFGQRNENFTKTTVETISFADLVAQFGIPYYLKVDIEGADQFCLQALKAMHTKPAFVSVEACGMELLISLGDSGYDRFQLPNQALNPLRKLPTTTREGQPVAWTFPLGSSGPFGHDLQWDRWLTLPEIMHYYLRIYTEWGKSPDYDLSWFDFHATRQSTLEAVAGS